MTSPATRLADPDDDFKHLPLPAKPKFGDRLINPWASESNPIRTGIFVREFRRSGRLNPGTIWEFTDGSGRFWEINREAFRRPAPPAPPDALEALQDEITEAAYRAWPEAEDCGYDAGHIIDQLAEERDAAVAQLTATQARSREDAELIEKMVVDAFDLGFSWARGLQGQNLEDSRAVGRTLQSYLFSEAGLTVNTDEWDSFTAADIAICESKRRIKAALVTKLRARADELEGRT